LAAKEAPQIGTTPPVLCAHPLHRFGASKMLDVILVAGAIAFFALSLGYVVACDRL
jgi:hypothetical protein